MKQKFTINGMSCNHCVATVEKAVNELPGIQKVKVNLKKNEGVVKSMRSKSRKKLPQQVLILRWFNCQKLQLKHM